MKELLQGIGMMAVSFVLGIFVILPFTVYVIQDVALLFHIDFITNTSKEVLYGIMLILWIMKSNKKREKPEKDFDMEQATIDTIKHVAMSCVLILISWGTAYFVHLKF